MSTTLEIINSLRTEFIQEAQSAPKLFKDLAKVEHYIAESYKTRSFIELIQNAYITAQVTGTTVVRLLSGRDMRANLNFTR